MIKFLKISAAVALVSVAAASFASAGLNAGGTAQLYWAGATNAPLTGAANRNSTAGVAKILVTAKGLVNFRGCDVQLIINALDKAGVPGAWQFQLGGCAEGFANFDVGGKVASKNAFNVAPSVLGVVPSQNGFNFNTGDCRSPHGVGLFWLSAAGANGGTRVLATEYNLWMITVDLATSVDPLDGVTPCEGGTADPLGPRGVCINPNFKIPCNGPQLGAAVQILDGNLDLDAFNFVQGSQYLTWNAGSRGDGAECPNATAIRNSSWGTLKKIYK